MKLGSILLISAVAAVRVEEQSFGTIFYASHETKNKLGNKNTQSLVEEKYGDVTVFVAPRAKDEPIEAPSRYSQDSDDTLMNTLITKGYAFSREKGSADVKVTVDCGCNCQCCFG